MLINDEMINFVYFIWGFFTWPNPDDWMNMTQIIEHDRKIDNDEH